MSDKIAFPVATQDPYLFCRHQTGANGCETIDYWKSAEDDIQIKAKQIDEFSFNLCVNQPIYIQ